MLNQSELKFEDAENARAQAREDLRKKLVSGFSLKNVRYLKEEALAKHNAVEKELSFYLSKSIGEANKAQAKVQHCEQEFKLIKAGFDELRRIWLGGSGQLSTISEPLDKLLIAKRNTDRLLRLLREYVEIDREVEHLQNALETNSEDITHVYKKMKILAYLRNSIVSRLENPSDPTQATGAAASLRKV